MAIKRPQKYAMFHYISRAFNGSHTMMANPIDKLTHDAVFKMKKYIKELYFTNKATYLILRLIFSTFSHTCSEITLEILKLIYEKGCNSDEADKSPSVTHIIALQIISIYQVSRETSATLLINIENIEVWENLVQYFFPSIS